MDRMLYVAMSGAKETALAQARNTHNLANTSTTGFKASLDAFSSRHVTGPVHETRTYAVTEDQRVDLNPGSLQATGRDLDVAVQDRGWIAVQAPDGGEAYTRRPPPDIAVFVRRFLAEVYPQLAHVAIEHAWGETFGAGDVILGQADTGNFGLIQAGGLEASNVDIAQQLVNLITAQRNFQANAQVISTADTVTQTIINIRR